MARLLSLAVAAVLSVVLTIAVRPRLRISSKTGRFVLLSATRRRDRACQEAISRVSKPIVDHQALAACCSRRDGSFVSLGIAIRPVRISTLIPSGSSILIKASTLSTSPVTSIVCVLGEESTILARKISANRIASSQCSGRVCTLIASPCLRVTAVSY